MIISTYIDILIYVVDMNILNKERILSIFLYLKFINNALYVYF